MGRSITCNFQVEVVNETGNNPIYGAMSLKDVRGIILSEIDYQKVKVLHAVIFPQTKTGENYLRGCDYLQMDTTGKVERKFIDLTT